MTKQDLMKANRDPQREIKVCQAHLIHVSLKRVDYDPNKPEINSTIERVSVFPPEEFERMEKMNTPTHSVNGVKFQQSWVRVAGFQEGRVIHDGRLIDQDLRDEIQGFWDSLLKPKQSATSTVEQLAQEIKNMKRAPRIVANLKRQEGEA